MSPVPKILVFDSGLGGLTVYSEILKIRFHADYVYCADDAGFPYGPLSEKALVARVLDVMDKLIDDHAPDLAIIACNTASTLALPHLRARWEDLPFVGTVPAIKPAAERSRSRMISVLATPGTVARDYMRALVEQFAEGCDVTLVGSRRLAEIAERFMRGETIADGEVAREIAPCFRESVGARTDEIVLACTHYPLLLDHFERLAPWPVEWIDPAPAIARRADALLMQKFGPDAGEERTLQRLAVFTSGKSPEPALAERLAAYGLRVG